MYTLALSPKFERILKNLKHQKPDVLRELERVIRKVLADPTRGKPLRNVLKNFRRVHVLGSLVLVYEIHGLEVRLLDFDHHNKVYKIR